MALLRRSNSLYSGQGVYLLVRPIQEVGGERVGGWLRWLVRFDISLFVSPDLLLHLDCQGVSMCRIHSLERVSYSSPCDASPRRAWPSDRGSSGPSWTGHDLHAQSSCAVSRHDLSAFRACGGVISYVYLPDVGAGSRCRFEV